jgi:hypothetical protein
MGQRNDATSANLLSAYVKQLTTEGEKGPRIGEIQILTPFTQVVDESRQHTSDYTEQQALQDYRQRGDSIVVRVLLMLPAAFPKQDDKSSAGQTPSEDKNDTIRPENFWQNFQFNVKQHEKIIPSRSVQHKPIYSAATKDAPSVLDGAAVLLEYDSKDIGSDEITVDVIGPEGKTVTTTFDLKKLR